MICKNFGRGKMAGVKSDSTEKWRFVIFISKFGFHLIVGSISKAFGVLLNDMILLFDTNVAVLGLLCSIPISLMLIACPVIAPILSDYGGSPRLISLLGMTCGFCALILSSLTSSCVLFGIYLTVLGIGLSMGYMASYVMLDEYFPMSFILLNTVTEVGSSVGVLFIPFLLDQCRQAYGYSGAMLIFSAIFSHLLAGSATLRQPPSKDKCKVPDKLEYRKEPGSRWNGHEGATMVSQSNSVQMERREVIEGRGDSKGGKTGGDPEEIVKSNPNATESCCSDGGKTTPFNLEKQLYEAKNIQEKCLDGKDLMQEELLDHTRSSESYAGYSANDDMDENCQLLSHQTELSARDKIVLDKGEGEFSQRTSIKRFFVNSIFVQEPLFTLLLPLHCMNHVCAYSWMLFLVPHAEWQGIGSSEAALLSSIGGAGALLGRMSLAILIYFGLDLFVICLISSVVAAATFLIDPWCTSYSLLCVTAFVQGCTMFINSTGRASMCKVTTSSHTFVRGCGYAALSSGIGGIAGCFLAGVIYNETDSFHVVFMFLGSTQVLLALNIVIYLLIIHFKGNGHTVV
ncbi:uncharacterized protein LOC129273033 [Lytechinus pictus]|uniref:uncharacterized protein LOC129273033 n=1 Tax=Lytechinus pictus TaxID=7653 RepID=UPI0030B9DAF4